LDRVRSFLKFAGKGERKVLAVFATSAEGARRAVRYLRRELPDLAVHLFAAAPPDSETASMCESVIVETDSMALLVEAEKLLWKDQVALCAATWTGDRLRWPVKLAPFFVPPGRALILNRHGDFVPGTLANVRIHALRSARDQLHSGWNRAQDLARAYALWLFARIAQRFAPLSRAIFHRWHGAGALDLPLPEPAPGGEVAVFRYGYRRWDHAALDALIRGSSARYLLFLESGAACDARELTAPFLDPLAFAVARQTGYRAWKPALFPIAPFRTLQPGEAAQTTGPLSEAILVDRAKLAALGLPHTIVPGSAWMLLFWKAAAAGWRCFSMGGARRLDEFPDWPYEDAEFVTRVFSDPALRALAPREPEMGRGAVAFHPVLNRAAARDDERPHVLVISPYLPWPLSHGGAVRIWSLCRALAPHVRFTLAAFREAQDAVDYERLHEVFAEVYVVDRDQRARRDASLPEQVREHESAALRALVARLRRERPIDVLQVEFTHLAHFRDAAPDTPAILVEHDLTYTLYRQYAAERGDRASQQEAERWLAYERKWLAAYDAVWTMSEEDRAQAVAEGAPAGTTFTVANGVDIARFTPAHAPAAPPEVLYIGSFRHRPNILGFERLRSRIMPAVWERFPDARLHVVAGPEPEKYWTRPAALDPRIDVEGFVADVRPLYARAAAVAVPLVVSAGTNIKVMEAMACAKAIVSTSVGCQGLGLADGVELLVRDDPDQFAEALRALLGDEARAAALGRRARLAAEARFSWDAIAEAAMASYRRLTRERAASSIAGPAA
jgi:glycosyltransferase involved in cell wall biosynthesis